MARSGRHSVLELSPRFRHNEGTPAARAAGLVEPSAMTLYANRLFNDTTSDGGGGGGLIDEATMFNGATGWWNATPVLANGNFDFPNDATAPVDPPQVGRVIYRAGLASGDNPMGSIHAMVLPSGVRTIWVEQWIKLSAGWVPPSNSLVAKLGFCKRIDDSAITYLALSGAGSPYTLSLRTQNFVYNNPPPNGHVRNVGNVGDDSFPVNQWNLVQYCMVMNSAAGANDGEILVALNNKLIVSTLVAPYNGSVYDKPSFWDNGLEAAKGFWQGPSLEPTWGGGAGVGLPAEQYASWAQYRCTGKAARSLA